MALCQEYIKIDYNSLDNNLIVWRPLDSNKQLGWAEVAVDLLYLNYHYNSSDFFGKLNDKYYQLNSLTKRAEKIFEEYLKASQIRNKHILNAAYNSIYNEICVLKNEIKHILDIHLSRLNINRVLKNIKKIASFLNSFIKYTIRNIRYCFRMIVNILFKNMDDESDVLVNFQQNCSENLLINVNQKVHEKYRQQKIN